MGILEYHTQSILAGVRISISWSLGLGICAVPIICTANAQTEHCVTLWLSRYTKGASSEGRPLGVWEYYDNGVQNFSGPLPTNATKNRVILSVSTLSRGSI